MSPKNSPHPTPPHPQHWQLQADTVGPFGLIRPIPRFCLRVEETLPSALAVRLAMLTGAAVGQDGAAFSRRGNSVSLICRWGAERRKPVLQTCDVATDERNWNNTSSSGAATSSFKPRRSGAQQQDTFPPNQNRNRQTQREGSEVLAGADGSAGPGPPPPPPPRLASHASCRESTHRSVSICFCASLWLSPLPQVEKNGGVHRTM